MRWRHRLRWAKHDESNEKTSALLLAWFSLAPAISPAATPAPDERTAAPRIPGVSAGSALIRAAAEVVAIDTDRRILTLRREDGNTLTVVADGKVARLESIRTGDIVIARYGHARALSMQRLAATAEAGMRPADAPLPSASGPAPRTSPRSLVADIIAIDDRTRQATFKGIDGSVVDVVFRKRSELAGVRIGDRVRLDHTDAVAISVTPAGRMVSSRRHHAAQ